MTSLNSCSQHSTSFKNYTGRLEDLAEDLVYQSFPLRISFFSSLTDSFLERGEKDSSSGRVKLGQSLKNSAKEFLLSSHYLSKIPFKNSFKFDSVLELQYPGSMRDLAYEVEALRYDATLVFLQSFLDLSKDQYERLSSQHNLDFLKRANDSLDRGIEHLYFAWHNHCKQYMNISDELFYLKK